METIKIFYIPFGIETYIPVTISNIEERSFYFGHVDESGQLIKCLLEFVEKASPGAIDRKRIRAKIVFSQQKVIYIDNDGGVLFGSEQKALDKRKLAKLDKLFKSSLTRS